MSEYFGGPAVKDGVTGGLLVISDVSDVNAGTSGNSGNADKPSNTDNTGKSSNVDDADNADKSSDAGNADTADKLGKVGNADTAGKSSNAGNADTAGKSGNVGNADNVGKSSDAGNVDTACKLGKVGNADTAGKLGNAGNADTAGKSGNADTVDTAGKSSNAGNAFTSVTSVIGKHYASGLIVRIHMRNGVIAEVEPLPEYRARGEELPFVGPGLVDLHINGYAGMDVNEEQPQTETLKRMSRAVWKEGVTAFCPTIVTNSDVQYRLMLQNITQACREDPAANAAMPGIHVEGPFISPEDGARGAHPLQHVTAPDWTMFQRWQEAAEGRIKLITLSPEWPESLAFIERCVKSGVIVSIGHTSASPRQIADAIAAGATLSTHLGNGAHLTLPRHPNYIWEQLSSDSLHACVIADGFHVPASFLNVARKTKREKLILVSDAVKYSGMEAGEYDNSLIGEVVLTPEGRLHLKRNAQLLAGSAQMLPHCIAHMVKHRICGLAEAWESASVVPSGLMGWSASQGLSAGAPADLVLFRWDGDKLDIEATFKNGINVFTRK